MTIAETALHRVVRAREVVEQVLASGAPVYGMTTGLGALARNPIPLEELRLAPKEALALVSANGLTTGFGSMVLADVADLLDALQVSAPTAIREVDGGQRPAGS